MQNLILSVNLAVTSKNPIEAINQRFTKRGLLELFSADLALNDRFPSYYIAALVYSEIVKHI